MAVLPGDNGPDQGQLMAAAGNRRSGETQREPAMLIEVRGATSRRFSAPQRPIRCPLTSLHQPSLGVRAAALRSRRAQHAVRSGCCAS